MKKTAQNMNAVTIMLQLLMFVKPLRFYMLLAITAGIVGFLCAIALPVLGVAVLLQPEQMGMLLAIMCVLAFMRGILRYGEQLCNHYIAFRLLALLRDKIFAALRKLCPAKLEGRDKGDLIAMITSDIELLEVFYAHTISPIIIAIGTSLIMVMVQLQFHPLLAVFSLVAYLVVGLLLPVWNTNSGNESGVQYRTKFSDISGHLLDSLQGLREVVQFGYGEQRMRELNIQSDSLEQLQKRLKFFEGRNKVVTDCVILLSTVCQVVLAAYLVAHNGLAAEFAVVSVILQMSSFGPVLALSNLSNNLMQTLAAGRRVLQLLQETPMVEENEDGVTVAFDSAAFEKVDFAYQQEQILKDFDLQITPGTLLGIQGKSGSGKSTILKLLMRFWDPQAGQIVMAGKNLKEIATKSLRQNQSYCTQETYLFYGTIAENITLGNTAFSQLEIEQAAQKAALHSFICSLPDGYQTVIGPKDNGLSGGQQQRIGLARLFLYDAPLLMLDEPTSNLDSLNENIILKSLQENKAGKTILLVSHRNSTLRIADQIFKMEQQRNS